MKHLPVASLVLLFSLAAWPVTAAPAPDAATLAELARSHEQVCKTLGGDHVAVVIQKGDKQFTIYGVTAVHAVGPVLEITVKNGEKYSVSAADVFFISNNGFKI
jgi:hypothetical protein